MLIVASSKQKRGENSAYNSHKRRNEIKIHAFVSREGFPLTIQISSGKELLNLGNDKNIIKKKKRF